MSSPQRGQVSPWPAPALPSLIRRYPLFADALAGLTAAVVTELGPPGAAVVALRVDLDALPIEERTGLSWASI